MTVDFYSFFREKIRVLPYISASARGALYRAAIETFDNFLKSAIPPIDADEASAVRRRIYAAIDEIEQEFELAREAGQRMPWWALGDDPAAAGPHPATGGALAFEYLGSEDRDLIKALARYRRFSVMESIGQLFGRIRSISAIIRHYVHSTAGSDVLGYLWTLFEPLMQMTLVVSMYWFFGISSIQGMPAIPFAITGVGCWLMIRMIMMRLCMGMGREFVLCTFPVILPLDVKIAKTVYYSMMYFVVCGFFIYVDALYNGRAFEIDDVILVCLIWMTLSIMAFGLGLMLGRLFVVIPETHRLIMLIFRVMYLFSGAFIISEQLPTEYQSYFLWNPMMHGLQLFRSAFFVEYDSVQASEFYFVIWTFAILVFGVICERANYREEITA